MEVLVPDVEAAEDLNLHAPHQQPNLTFRELIVLFVGYRQPEPSKPN